MEINVAQLLKSPIGSMRDYEVKELVDCGEGENPVEGRVRLTRTNRGILVTGSLHTESRVTCSRCLCRYTCPLDLTIEEEYFPTIDVSSGVPVRVPDEPGAFTIDEHHTLDLTEAICQYTLMEIPMKPLCREECAGLCAQCGKDLNKGPCDCPHEEPDPRWGKLLEAYKTAERKKRKK